MGRKSKRRKKRGTGAQSLLTPISLDKLKGYMRDRAEELYQFIKKNPNCNRQDMIAAIHWADADKVRKPLRILFTEKRIGVRDTSGYKWKFFAVPYEVAWSNRLVSQGKIEERKCNGTNKDGNPCRTPALYVRSNGYCMHHAPQTEPPAPPTKYEKIRNRWDESLQKKRDKTPTNENDIVPHYQHEDNENDDGYITYRIRIPIPSKNNEDGLRDLITAFLNGKASIQDLREAVE